MQNPQLQNQSPQNTLYDENILVIARSELFAKIPAWHGINSDITQYQDLITQHGCFMPRCHAETNPMYKQIIPYMLFIHDKKLFVMQRKSSASEQRLASKFSIGIGGHIRHEDIANKDIINWANREFEEEVTYHGSKKINIVGILNDDSSDVGKVHVGIIMVVQADSDKISINDEHKSGILMTLNECIALQAQMESWSKICLDFLIKNNIL